MVDNPWATVRTIYEHFGLDAGDGRPRRHGSVAGVAGAGTTCGTATTFEDYDLDLTPKAVDTAFARYRQFIAGRGIRT